MPHVAAEVRQGTPQPGVRDPELTDPVLCPVSPPGSVGSIFTLTADQLITPNSPPALLTCTRQMQWGEQSMGTACARWTPRQQGCFSRSGSHSLFQQAGPAHQHQTKAECGLGRKREPSRQNHTRLLSCLLWAPRLPTQLLSQHHTAFSSLPLGALGLVFPPRFWDSYLGNQIGEAAWTARAVPVAQDFPAP